MKTFFFFLAIFNSYYLYSAVDDSCRVFVPENIVLNELNSLDNLNKLHETEVIIKGRKLIRYSFLNPKFLYYFNDNKIGYFFGLPGDSIFLENNEKGQVILKSKKYYIEHEILNEFNENNLALFPTYEGNNISIFNNFLEANINSLKNINAREKIINTFQNKASTIFIEYLFLSNKIKRLDFLLSPFNPCSEFPNFLPPINRIEFEENINEGIAELSKLKKEDIDLFSIWISKIIPNYLNYKTIGISNEKKYTKKIEIALNIFSGEALNVALTSIMIDKGVDTDFFNNNSELYFQKCTNEEYKKLVHLSSNLLKLVNSDQFLSSAILKGYDGFETSLKEILVKHKGKVIYIDFWASWCAGCKLEIPNIKDKIIKYSSSLVVIFISKDSKEINWKKNIKNWSFPENSEHYLINPDSRISKTLTEPSIPRGAVIDKNGTVVSIHFESPSSIKFDQQILKYF